MGRRHADAIVEGLEEMILDGSFADGERLDEATLGARFGTSRTPVREAVQRLAQSGLVELLPRRGAFVRQPGPVELLEMFEVMAEIEAACARLAAARIGDAALEELGAANRACRGAVEAGDADAYYRANETFHHILYRESGNRFLEGEALRLHRRLRPFRRLQLRLRGRMPQSMAEHEGIVDALADGRAEDAAGRMRAHVAVQGEKFQYLMASLRPAAE